MGKRWTTSMRSVSNFILQFASAWIECLRMTPFNWLPQELISKQVLGTSDEIGMKTCRGDESDLARPAWNFMAFMPLLQMIAVTSTQLVAHIGSVLDTGLQTAIAIIVSVKEISCSNLAKAHQRVIYRPRVCIPSLIHPSGWRPTWYCVL